jgi:hypothetical protein
MPADAARALLAADPALFRTALTFNRRPVAYIAPERLAADEPMLPAEAWRRLLATPRLSARLSARILGRYGLAGRELWDFEPRRRRLALLDVGMLRQIAVRAGALLHSAAIRRVVMREGVMAVRGLLGEEGHAFALKRAPFLPLPVRLPEPADPASVLERDGLSCLAAWLEREPEPLARRVRLRFPPGTAIDAPTPGLEGEAGRKVLALTLREGEPAWRDCCD